MSKVYAEKDALWKIFNSWWILLTFIPFGMASFIAFFYVGLKVKKWGWCLFGLLYLILMVTLMEYNEKSTSFITGGLILLYWIITIYHVFKIRPVYLDNINGFNTNKEELIKNRNLQLRQEAESYSNDTKIHNSKVLLRDSTQEFNFNTLEEIMEIKPNQSAKVHQPLRKDTSGIRTNIALNSWETGLFRSKIKRKLRNEIRKQIVANPNSLNHINKIYKSTGNINHPLLKSFKEKIILEIRTHIEFKKFKDSEIEIYIEEDIKKVLKKFF